MSIDFSEAVGIQNGVKLIGDDLLGILLKDKTTGKNIIWATEDYQSLGEGYGTEDEIQVTAITGENESVIKPRTEKAKDKQTARVRNKAEVFTPSWICNEMNNLLDADWFGRRDVFNTESEKSWVTNEAKITFPEGKTWKDYVLLNRLEITCGEAPYLASRYDATTGKVIPVKDRIGLLDRKLRVVSENAENEPEWYEWAVKAVQSVYGFEWQGDNLLIARENLLLTFFDHYTEHFIVPPIKKYMRKIARVLSWNLWQMDGLKYVVPNSCKPVQKEQLSIFGEDVTTEPCPGCKTGDNRLHSGIYCRVMDWKNEHSVRFIDLSMRRVKHGRKV